MLCLILVYNIRRDQSVRINTIALDHIVPASILYKSIAGRYRPVSYPDGPITARYRFIKNAYWGRSFWVRLYSHVFNTKFRCYRFMPGVECPDPAKAPPRPTTTAKTTSVTTIKPTTRLVKITSDKQVTTAAPKPPTPVTQTIINGSLTAIAGKFPGRPGEFERMQVLV